MNTKSLLASQRGENMDYYENISKERWLMGEKEIALTLFKQCVEEDLENAKELFEVNPLLLNVPEFVHLTAE